MINAACFDLECTSLNADFGIILCGAVKPAGQTTKVFRLDELSRTWDTRRSDDRPVIRRIVAELDEYDILVAHNGLRYDLPFLRTRMARWGMRPLREFKLIDPVQILRNKFKLSGNSLDKTTDFLGINTKTSVDGNMWLKAALDGDRRAMNYICRHCVTPNHLTLTADLRWVPLGDIKVGDRLVAFEEEPSSPGGRHYRTAEVEEVYFAEDDVYDVELSSGHTICTTADHRWLAGLNHSGGFRWIETRNMRQQVSTATHATKVAQVFPLFRQATDFDSGWLSGLLDGEGCVSGAHVVTFGQRPGVVLDKATEILGRVGSRFSLRITNRPYHTGLGKKDCVSVQVNGSLPERLALLGTLRPVRLLPKVNPDLFGRLERRNEVHEVVQVIPRGRAEIVRIKTSTGTLFVDGYPMHNCVEDVKMLEQVVNHVKSYSKTFNSWGSSL